MINILIFSVFSVFYLFQLMFVIVILFTEGGPYHTLQFKSKKDFLLNLIPFYIIYKKWSELK